MSLLSLPRPDHTKWPLPSAPSVCPPSRRTGELTIGVDDAKDTDRTTPRLSLAEAEANGRWLL